LYSCFHESLFCCDHDFTFRWYDFLRSSVCALVILQASCIAQVSPTCWICGDAICSYNLVWKMQILSDRWQVFLYGFLHHVTLCPCETPAPTSVPRPVPGPFRSHFTLLKGGVEWLIDWFVVMLCGVEYWGWMCFIYNWRGSLSSGETKRAWLIDSYGRSLASNETWRCLYLAYRMKLPDLVY
jgi:hypothetical protein